MGIYLNQDNKKFEVAVKTKPYIDKSMLISFTNSQINTEFKYICVTRPRRFGKSMGLNMLNAYYSKGCDSKDLFKDLKISNDSSFKIHLNKHNVIYINILNYFKDVNDKNDFIPSIIKSILSDLKEKYSEIINLDMSLFEGLNKVYVKTGDTFIFLIDEWDYPFIRAPKEIGEEYINLLGSLFKGDTAYLDMAYMTGVLPIKKYSVTSDLNNFCEYTMIDPSNMASYFGFTDDEVKTLCNEYNMDYNQMKRWYDGYKLSKYEIYNPLSVITAIKKKKYGDYWTDTSNVDVVLKYIETKDYTLKKELIELLSGERPRVDVSTFNGDIQNINTRDKALTALCHLGYLGYSEYIDEFDNIIGSCYIPNNEIRLELEKLLKNLKEDYLYKFIDNSSSIIEALYNKDIEVINEIFDDYHFDFANQFDKNLEVSLKYIIMLSFINLKNTHYTFQELSHIKGRADIVYVPKNEGDKPLIVVELKHNLKASGALAQIKNKEYPKSVKDYHGKILLLGINYDDNFKHETVIEEINK